MKKGFTLIELIIVIAVIAILAAAIFVAIDPARRLHEARNARRWSDIATILDAVKGYQADNEGTHYYKIEGMETDEYYLIGTSTDFCDITCVEYATKSSCIDLSEIGSNYLAVILVDPKESTEEKTGYAILKDVNGAITIIACNAEGEGAGGLGEAPIMTVTR
jgi:prepilin-type N-terminal cleavage/methylation domain-containing protein